MRMKNKIIIHLTLVFFVFLIFLITLGFPYLLNNMIHYWKICSMMSIGSIIGGGTSEGGGAVSFPVMTKILHVDPKTSRIFTFAIQSVGMSAASLYIILTRTKIETKVLIYAVPPAIIGTCVSVLKIADSIPMPTIRICFTAMVLALGIAIEIQSRVCKGYSYDQIPLWNVKERAIVMLVGFLGGILSGIAGVGENIIMFMLLVLLFRVSKSIATPTTVVLLTMTSIAAFMLHIFVVKDFHGIVVNYWQAAAPIVVLGAPLGAWICSQLTEHIIKNILLLLIALEVISTVLIVNADLYTWALGSVAVITIFIFAFWFIKIETYTEISYGTQPRIIITETSGSVQNASIEKEPLHYKDLLKSSL